MKIQNNLKLEGNNVISYETHVATINQENNTLEVHGRWSQTTSRHINKVAKMYDLEKVDKKVEEDDVSGSLLKASAMFAVLADFGDDPLTKKNNFKKRMLNTNHGISFPDDFDSLPEEVRKERLDNAIKVALKK